MNIAIPNVIIGMLKLATIGWIWDVDPKALSKFDIKYKKNIMINELIIILENLSFCLIPWTRQNAKRTRVEIKNGRLIRLYRCILKSIAE